MRPHLSFLAGVVAAMAFSTPVMAGAPTVAVSYDDLNLTSAEGQAELQQRLNKAAWKVCMFDERGVLRTGDDYAVCYHVTRKDVAVQFARVVGEHQFGG